MKGMDVHLIAFFPVLHYHTIRMVDVESTIFILWIRLKRTASLKWSRGSLQRDNIYNFINRLWSLCLDKCLLSWLKTDTGSDINSTPSSSWGGWILVHRDIVSEVTTKQFGCNFADYVLVDLSPSLLQSYKWRERCYILCIALYLTLAT